MNFFLPDVNRTSEAEINILPPDLDLYIESFESPCFASLCCNCSKLILFGRFTFSQIVSHSSGNIFRVFPSSAGDSPGY